MNKLQKAYQVLGLDPGMPLDAIRQRYKQLVIVWHPDRMANDAGRRAAEEELKKINNAFDLLKNHFQNNHSRTACECQSDTSNSNQHGARDTGEQPPNPSEEEDKKRREQEAQCRERERKRRAEEETRQSEAAQKADEQKRTDDAAKQATEQAFQQEQILKDEQIRWQAARLAGIACVVLLGFGWFGVTARAAVSDFQRQWSSFVQSINHSPSISSRASNNDDAQPTSPPPRDPYQL